MEYTVVQASNYTDFDKFIREHLQQGWKPQGGISVATNVNGKSGILYSQALVKLVVDTTVYKGNY